MCDRPVVTRSVEVGSVEYMSAVIVPAFRTRSYKKLWK
jgi:hypothetical protein